MNLTNDQKRFAIFSAASLVAVLIIIFLIYGLQDINFDASKEAAFEAELVEKQGNVLEIVYAEQKQALVDHQAYLAQFPNAEVLSRMVETDVQHVEMLEDVALIGGTVLDKTMPEANPLEANTLAEVCERILVEEFKHMRYIEEDYLQRALGFTQLQGALVVILNDGRNVQVQALNSCALEQ